MKVVKPETVGLDAAVLKNIREYLDETYVKEGKYAGTMTLVSRKGEVAYLDSLGMMDRENKRPMQEGLKRAYQQILVKFLIAVLLFFCRQHLH